LKTIQRLWTEGRGLVFAFQRNHPGKGTTEPSNKGKTEGEGGFKKRKRKRSMGAPAGGHNSSKNKAARIKVKDRNHCTFPGAKIWNCSQVEETRTRKTFTSQNLKEIRKSDMPCH